MYYRYVFDLDNTLVMTNILNNDAYNYALTTLRMPPINTHARITRKVVFELYPHLPEIKKNQIVELKQNYFKDNLNHSQPNLDLINFLQSKTSSHCILWTSADKVRVIDLLMHYKIDKNFISVLYSNKFEIYEDTKEICKIFNCSSKQLIFFEDDENIINRLQLLEQKVFTSKCKINLNGL